MSIKLRELIRQIRACKTKQEERTVVARECALIRTAFKEDDNQFRHRNVAKLLFIHMMGYPTHFGQMECLKLIASSRFPEKRVGYLGLTLLLDETTEVLMLVTNSIKHDMTNNSSQYVNGLALCALGDIGSEDMCQGLSSSVEQLLGSSTAYLRKKAALAALRVIRKVEETEDKFNSRIKDLFEERDHGVLITACALLTALLEKHPEYVPSFRKLVPGLVRTLKQMCMSGYANAAEYDVSGITDPFLQVKILRLLRVFGAGSPELSEEMNDILAQVVTNTEGTKNPGNSILYEAVMTIMCIESEGGLRVLGINVLGRFLLNRDANIKYVALTTLKAVVSRDVKAVQRHKATILECLKDPDPSIRKRALAVTHAIVNEENIKGMTKELLNFLLVADAEFKEDLVQKICSVVEKYSPDARWQVDTHIKVMCLAGNVVDAATRASFCTVVQNTAGLQAYAVHKLFFSMKENITQEALVQVGVWCLGEYGDLLVGGNAVGPEGQSIVVQSKEVIDLIAQVIKRPPGDDSSKGLTNTQELCAIALVKLSTRVPDQADQIRQLLKKMDSSISVELQQRTCEFLALLEPGWTGARAGILDKMPANKNARRPVGDTTLDEAPRSGASASLNGGGSAPVGGGDLLDLLGGDPTPAPAATGYPAAAAPPPAASGPMDDLMGLFGAPEPAPAPAAPANAMPPITVLDKDGFRIQMQGSKGLDPNQRDIVATFTNSGAPVSGLHFQAAVPKYLQLEMSPASSSSVATGGSATQNVNVRYLGDNQKPVVMKLKVDYEVNGMQKSEMLQATFEGL